MKNHSIQKTRFFIVLIIFITVIVLYGHGQPVLQTIDLPSSTLNSDGGTLAVDILEANSKIFIYSPDGISVYNGSNNSFIRKIYFDKKQGKFNPVFFNNELFPPDQKLMVFNNEPSSDSRYIFAMTPEMELMVIDIENINDEPYLIQLEAEWNDGNISFNNLFTSQNGRCIMKYDTIGGPEKGRLFVMVSGKNFQDPYTCPGNFHYGINVFCVYQVDYNIIPDQEGFLTRIFNDVNGSNSTVGSYQEQVNNFGLNEITGEILIVRLGYANNINNPTHSVIEIWDLNISNQNYQQRLQWEPPGATGYFKTGKLLYINDNGNHKFLIFPYRYPSSGVPNPQFLVLDCNSNYSMQTFDCVTTRVMDAAYLEDEDELLICYSPDDEVISQYEYSHLARYEYNGSFTLNQTYFSDASPETSLYDHNTAFKFVKLDGGKTLLGKKDEIAKLDYDQPELNYTNVLTCEANFFCNGVSTSSQKAFILNTTTSGFSAYSEDGNGDVSFNHIRTGYPVYHICSNIDGSILYCYNKMNVYNNGLYVYYPNSSNSTVTLIADDLGSAIGDCEYNPSGNHFLISKFKPNEAEVHVLNADNNSHERTINLQDHLQEASFAKDIFVSPDGRIFICANMQFQQSAHPFILVYDANNYDFLYMFEVEGIDASDLEKVVYYSAYFTYNEPTNSVFAAVNIQDLKQLPYNPETSKIYDSDKNASLPGALLVIDGQDKQEFPLNNYPGKVICPNSAFGNISSQYTGKAFIAGKKLVVYNYLNETITDTTSYDHEFIDIMYHKHTDTLFALKDVAGEQCSHWRRVEIWKIYYDQDGELMIEEYKSGGLSFNGQFCGSFANPYDGRIYIHQKIDHEKLGTQEMKLRSFDPLDTEPQWDSVGLGMYSYYPEYDHTADPAKSYFYNLTTPYLCPHNNSIYLPNGGHSCISKVSFEPNEAIPLEEGEWTWISFPRMQRDGNNPVSIPVVFGGGQQPEHLIEPSSYADQSKLQYLAPNGSMDESFYNTDFGWNFGAGLLTDVQSTLGYKLYLNYGQPVPEEKKWLYLKGSLYDHFDPGCNNCLLSLNGEEDEYWVGYYHTLLQSVPDALPDELEPKISMVKGQYFTCYSEENQTEQILWRCVCNRGRAELGYADMAIIKLKAGEVINDFYWAVHNNDPSAEEKSATEYYSYTETSDYTPIFVELDTTDNPLEIGAFVNDSCIGGTTVLPTDSVVLVQAYTDSLTGEIYFEEYYGSVKSYNAPLTRYYVLDNETKLMQQRMIHTAEKRDYYVVSFRDEQAAKTTSEAWIRCKPNPAFTYCRIEFYIPTDGRTVISLSDIRGAKQTVIHSGLTGPGKHEVTFNLNNIQGQSLPGGIYIISLVSGQHRSQTKLIIL